ncbi:VPLPA-CTERM sorting domain-containing protein [Phycobacter sp. K97]|uniref:VPLPA-CTERM sorting domain-containing protein n=1 Tax=Phycobacter sedimenti TaxID=3133977 RepID=UPI00311F1087
MTRFASMVSALSLALVVPMSAKAATLFSQTYTGAEFAALATLGPNATQSVSGNSVTYGMTSHYATLAEFYALSPGARGDMTFSVTINYDALTNDNDMAFGFTDGSGIIGAMQADNGSGTLYVLNGSPSNLSAIQNGTGFSNQISATFTVADGSGPATLSYTNGSYSVSDLPLSSTFDTDGVLGFALYGNNKNESYRINSVALEFATMAAVPLPAGGMLLLTGLLGTAAVRRRRRKS